MIRRLHDLLRHQERNSLQMRLAYLTAIGVALSAFCIGMATDRKSTRLNSSHT